MLRWSIILGDAVSAGMAAGLGMWWLAAVCALGALGLMYAVPTEDEVI